MSEIPEPDNLPHGTLLGKKVWTTVSAGGQTVRMAQGIVVGVHSGYCDVDVMSLHGGAPWIQKHTTTSLEVV